MKYKEIKISKRVLKVYFRCLFLSIILFSIAIPFNSEFQSEKFKVEKIKQKELAQTQARDRAKLNRIRELLENKNDPVKQQNPPSPSDPHDVQRLVDFINSPIDKSDLPGIVAPQNYSFDDFYIASIKIVPIIGNSYEYKFHDESFSWKDYISNTGKWNGRNKLNFYIPVVFYNFHLVVVFGLIIFLCYYVIKFLKDNIKLVD